mgnify:CR=1 FL=1
MNNVKLPVGISDFHKLRQNEYYYVDKTGVRVTTREVRQAVAFVMSSSKATDIPSKRLKTCFRALLKYPYYNSPFSSVINSVG